MTLDTVNWTPARAQRLAKNLERAKGEGKQTFYFSTGHSWVELDVGYAKYLLEYLASKFGEQLEIT